MNRLLWFVLGSVVTAVGAGIAVMMQNGPGPIVIRTNPQNQKNEAGDSTPDQEGADSL